MSNAFQKLSDWMLRALTARRNPSECDESIRRHLAQTGEQDHGLAAVREILALRLLEITAFEGAMSTSDTDKLRYAERRETLRCLYLELEHRLEDAKKWRKQQEQSGNVI